VNELRCACAERVEQCRTRPPANQILNCRSPRYFSTHSSGRTSIPSVRSSVEAWTRTAAVNAARSAALSWSARERRGTLWARFDCDVRLHPLRHRVGSSWDRVSAIGRATLLTARTSTHSMVPRYLRGCARCHAGEALASHISRWRSVQRDVQPGRSGRRRRRNNRSE
jgi:hypothetical protein